MALKTSNSTTSIPCSFLSLTVIFLLSLCFLFFTISNSTHHHQHGIFRSTHLPLSSLSNSIVNVYVAELPRSFNYDLLDQYWAATSPDSRTSYDPDHGIPHHDHRGTKYPPYPENPLIKQYSAEYWIMGDLETPENLRSNSVARRVFSPEQADVVFVPFFATLSAEMELAKGNGLFRKKVEGNEDYQRQKKVIEIVKKSQGWKRSGGRDHVFVLTDPVAMWHVKSEIAPAILLVVDFGGWYRLDSRSVQGSSSTDGIQHTQVSLLKDVIVPYTHLLPRLDLSRDRKRDTLLYFKGAKHRHRGGIIREQLWDLLVNEAGVIMEEGFPNATGREQSIKGMRSSEFCLHPAGDTPTSCRLFDAIQSLCIPVVVSDNIELPFEGMVNYSKFSVFVAVNDALKQNWLVRHLKSFSEKQKDKFRRKLAEVQQIFVYDNGYPGGIGPIPADGAVNYIWRKVHQKLPVIKEAIARERRKPPGVSIPMRCHCT